MNGGVAMDKFNFNREEMTLLAKKILLIAFITVLGLRMSL